MKRIDETRLRELAALARTHLEDDEPAHVPPPPLVVADDDYRDEHAELMARRVRGTARELPHGGEPTAADLRALLAPVGRRVPGRAPQADVEGQRLLAAGPTPQREERVRRPVDVSEMRERALARMAERIKA